MADLVLVGTGDHARVAFESAQATGWRVIAFVEPGDGEPVLAVADVPVIRSLQALAAADTWFIVAIGDNRVRAEQFALGLAAGGRAATLVHPSSVILGGARVEEGSHVCAGAVIGVDAHVGRNVIVNTAASVDHDGHIGDHAFVGPGARLGGRVTVGSGAHIGLGSSIIEGRRIGDWAYVAAGATVIRDVGQSTRVAGVPAREMREPKKGWEGR